jgi:hypothetical protein
MQLVIEAGFLLGPCVRIRRDWVARAWGMEDIETDFAKLPAILASTAVTGCVVRRWKKSRALTVRFGPEAPLQEIDPQGTSRLV